MWIIENRTISVEGTYTVEECTLEFKVRTNNMIKVGTAFNSWPVHSHTTCRFSQPNNESKFFASTATQCYRITILLVHPCIFSHFVWLLYIHFVISTNGRELWSKLNRIETEPLCFAVVTERNALALSRSPFCVQLFYSLQTSSCVYLVSLCSKCSYLYCFIFCNAFNEVQVFSILYSIPLISPH